MKATYRFDFRRFLNDLFCASLPLILFAASQGIVRAQVGTQTPAKPESIPSATSARKAVANEKSTGTIKGRVVSDNGQPLPNATAVVQSVTGTFLSSPVKEVDAKGEFVFDGLPAALYTVSAMAPGYQDQTLTAVEPAQAPRYLIGAQVRITMIKGGVITGTVLNSNGDPVVGVAVRALPGAQSTSQPDLFGRAATSETDDRGIYRIYGLLPGQYVVIAGGNRDFFRSSGFDRDVPTYYPSSARAAAVPIIVRSGEEATGVDIKYRGTEGRSITGVVLGRVQASAGVGAIVITLGHAGSLSTLAMALGGPLEERREFTFSGVEDGEYDLFAGFQTGSDNSTAATKRVIVRGADVAGIELNLMPLASINGTIALDPIKPEDKCDRRASQLIEIAIDAPREGPKKPASQIVNFFARSTARLSDKGEFTFPNLEAGKYRLEIKLPTEAWYVRAISRPASAAKNPQPLPTNPNQSAEEQSIVAVKAGERVNGLSISVAQDAAGLLGRVGLAAGGVVPAGARAHLVPAERDEANNTLRYSETLINSDASFAFTNVAPGRYYILSRVERPADSEPASSRPSAWDPTMRTKLRHDAETAKTIVELKPCQRTVDYGLKMTGAQ